MKKTSLKFLKCIPNIIELNYVAKYFHSFEYGMKLINDTQIELAILFFELEMKISKTCQHFSVEKACK